jgi:hypothetical protein
MAIRFGYDGAQDDFASTPRAQGEPDVLANHLHVGRAVGAYPSIGRQVANPVGSTTFRAIRSYQDEIVYYRQDLEAPTTVAIFYPKDARAPRSMRYALARRLKWKSQPAQLIRQQGAAAALIPAAGDPNLPLGPSRIDRVFRNVRSEDVIGEFPARSDIGRFHARLQSPDFLRRTSGVSTGRSSRMLRRPSAAGDSLSTGHRTKHQ